MPYPDFSHTIPALPHHPNKQGFFIGYFLTFHPILIPPLPFPPLPYPQMFSQSLSFNDAREERKRALKTLYTHTSIQKKQNSPHFATSKVNRCSPLEGKSCSSHLLRAASHLQASKQASKQARRWDREVPDILELIAHYPDWVSPPHLQCEFVCLFFFPWRLRQEDFFLLMGEMGFLGLVGARQHS